MTKKITYKEMLAIVHHIVDGCFMVDEDGTTYTPESRDFMQRFYILTYFSDIELPEDLDECYAKIYSDEMLTMYSDIVRDNLAIITSIFNSVDKKIDYRLSAMHTSVEDSLIKFINTLNYEITNLTTMLEDKISNIDTSILDKGNMEAMLGFAKNMEGIVDKTNTAEFAKALAGTIKPTRKSVKKTITKSK